MKIAALVALCLLSSFSFGAIEIEPVRNDIHCEAFLNGRCHANAFITSDNRYRCIVNARTFDQGGIFCYPVKKGPNE